MVAMLAFIGQINLPVELAAKINSGAQLTVVEKELLARTPEVARDLVGNIPRLESVAEAIYYQNRGFDGSGFPEDGKSGDAIPAYGRLLKILIDLEAASEGEEPTELTFDLLAQKGHLYDPKLLQLVHIALIGYDDDTRPSAVKTELLELKAYELRVGDVMATRLLNARGTLVLAAGQVLTEAALHKLQQYVKLKELAEPFRVMREVEGEAADGPRPRAASNVA
jgi:HD-GYP domain-containing protein (c-di-GMP phosphodiesterase class II)